MHRDYLLLHIVLIISKSLIENMFKEKNENKLKKGLRMA